MYGRIMQLVEVDNVGLQSFKALAQGECDIVWREIHARRIMVKVRPRLCGNYDISPLVFESLSEELFAMTMPISIGSVKEVAAKIQRLSNRVDRCLIIGRPITVSESVSPNGPGAEPDLANLQTRLT